ncbi:hypothetical protein Tsubulata_014005 [Turnera subulata]|uniref:NB-ARC domain-containing protein n=1 Tax=Turnera subulata TaxID=218843 RepID=A0A9Q0JGN1_9ROSI|nr:hypothetical protein Tsubulata_014005 [Turnera subulata]
MAVQKVADKLQVLHQFIQTTRNEDDIGKLNKAVYFIEDATDRFLARTRQRPSSSINKSLRLRWGQFLFGLQVKEFMVQIQTLGLSNSIIGSSSQSSTTTPSRGRGIICGSHFVVLDDQVKELVSLLVPEEGSSSFGSTEVISVVGEGGSGRTALVKAVFESVTVKRHFKKCVWVNVCNYGFKAREIVFEMLKQVDEMLAVAKEPVLEQVFVSRVTKTLREDRYLVVVDDLGGPESWKRLSNVFPRSDNGSRVVVITRNADVAACVLSNSRIETCRLNEEQSWVLFLNKARNNFPEMNVFKGMILKLCGGLPLVISLMGDLLSIKGADHSEWTRIIDNANNVGGDIFALYYQELPSWMKSCFLYTGLFPKVVEISVRRLLQLWIAEGLVAPICLGELGPEDVANMCLEELINRNMLEVSTWRSDGIPRTCHMPSASYDVFSKRAAEVGLFHIHSRSQYNYADQPAFAVQRLASYLGTKNYPLLDSYIGHLRSFISFDPKRGMPVGEIGTFLSKLTVRTDFGLLIVLDLEGVYKPRLPNTLGKLLNLRYIGLRSTALNSLPESVYELQNLETLDVKHTMITNLQSSIWMMKKLRHLYMGWIHFDDLQQSLDSEPLSQLQTLYGLSISQHSPILLGLRFSSASQDPISNWIAQLTNLQSLRLRSVKATGERGSIKLNTFSDHQKLVDLYLLGVLPRPIDVKRLPPNLKILTLSMSQLRRDPMRMLGKLSHLNVLRLYANSYLGEEMTCHGGGFPQLHVLKLWELVDLKEWTVEEGAMPCLREVEIRSCKRLNKVEGLRRVTTLKELILSNMPSSFGQEVEANIGTDLMDSTDFDHDFALALEQQSMENDEDCKPQNISEVPATENQNFLGNGVDLRSTGNCEETRATYDPQNVTVDIVTYTKVKERISAKAEDPDATEYSSSFADTDSDIERHSGLSEAEVESQFFGDSEASPYDAFGSLIQTRQNNQDTSFYNQWLKQQH